MCRRHADIWSHPSHYLVDPYTWPWSPNGQDHIWPFIENSNVKVMAKAKPIGYIWGLEFNRYVCFLFRGNQTIFGWDIWPWKFKVKVTMKIDQNLIR